MHSHRRTQCAGLISNAARRPNAFRPAASPLNRIFCAHQSLNICLKCTSSSSRMSPRTHAQSDSACAPTRTTATAASATVCMLRIYLCVRAPSMRASNGRTCSEVLIFMVEQKTCSAVCVGVCVCMLMPPRPPTLAVLIAITRRHKLCMRVNFVPRTGPSAQCCQTGRFYNKADSGSRYRIVVTSYVHNFFGRFE